MIYTYKKLEAAWRKEVSGKHGQENQANYEYNREYRLLALKDALIRKTFVPKPLKNKQIYIPKRRVAQVPGLEDKIVQHLICDDNVYRDVTKPLIRSTFACLKGRGAADADKRLKEQMRRFWRKNHKQPFILKCDIHSYFASIDHGRLKEIIGRYITDDDSREIVGKFLDLTEVGLPLGLEQNQLLANLYLSELDHMAKSKWHAEYYGRYMDDFYIISGDMEYLQWLWREIDDYVQSIGLTLNPKTAICRGRFDFLGFTYFLTDTGKVVKRLTKSKRKTQRNRCRLIARQLGEGKIAPEKAAESYRSWREHAMQGDCRKLVLSMDEHFRRHLKTAGFELKIEYYRKNNKIKERVTICREHSAS